MCLSAFGLITNKLVALGLNTNTKTTIRCDFCALLGRCNIYVCRTKQSLPKLPDRIRELKH